MVVTELELGVGLAGADRKAPTPARDGAASRLVRSCSMSVRTLLEITKLKLVRSQKNPWPSMNRPLAVRSSMRFVEDAVRLAASSRHSGAVAIKLVMPSSG